MRHGRRHRNVPKHSASGCTPLQMDSCTCPSAGWCKYVSFMHHRIIESQYWINSIKINLVKKKNSMQSLAQFSPQLRQRYTNYHRLNGICLSCLLLLSWSAWLWCFPLLPCATCSLLAQKDLPHWLQHSIGSSGISYVQRHQHDTRKKRESAEKWS